MVITKEFKEGYHVPKTCEECDRKPVIQWSMRVRQNPKNGITPRCGFANMGFCEYHASGLVSGLMKDLVEIQSQRLGKRKFENSDTTFLIERIKREGII